MGVIGRRIPHSTQCQRIQTACNARIHSNLCHELKHFLSKEDAERSALQLGMLIDGIWVRGGLNAPPLASSSAIAEMEYAIFKLLPSDKDSVEKHKKAREKIENVANILLNSNYHKENTLQT